jgi:SAM-dependent methyltransferase
MKDWKPETYGDSIAPVYDELYERKLEPTDAVATLAGLARGGPVLELGIGTGRVALPLAARGIDVHGIDASEAMVAKLRAKEGGAKIPVTIGDFADVRVAGTYPLIFVAFSTIFALVTQEDQLRCFRNVAAHLPEDGHFVLETFVPDLTRFARGQSLSAFEVDARGAHLNAAVVDPVKQTITSQHVLIGEGRMRLFPVFLRYAWPSELDLMAKLAGLRLRDRWADWKQTEFKAESQQHVSVYERE